MLSRRNFAAGLGLIPLLGELGLAQRARVNGPMARDMVWLNANENPDGPPKAALEAMTRALPTAGRYHYNEFWGLNQALARAHDLEPEQILVGAGSSEVLHCAVDAYTSPTRPLITVEPVYELPVELARAGGRPVVTTKLTSSWSADVKRLAAEAEKAGGGLIYLCNPNNPTSSITPKQDIAWLVANLPPKTTLLLDEAYIHFADSPEVASGLEYVRQGKPVIIARTFSKIWGMAGMRAGFAAAAPERIREMGRYINNVISWVTAQGVMAGLAEQKAILDERRSRLVRTRTELCSWLKGKGLTYIQPNANFVMIDVQRPAMEFIQAMPARGVAVGRPFPPLTQMLRVSIGTDADMAKFRDVFWQVYSRA